MPLLTPIWLICTIDRDKELLLRNNFSHKEYILSLFDFTARAMVSSRTKEPFLQTPAGWSKSVRLVFLKTEEKEKENKMKKRNQKAKDNQATTTTTTS